MTNTAILESKKRDIAALIEGRVVDEQKRVAVCIKGSLLGFPATLEAIGPNWPFGVTYYIETKVIVDPAHQAQPVKLDISPRMGKGPFAFLAHILLFEARGMPVADKRLMSRYVINYNHKAEAERFLSYPGMVDLIEKLDRHCHFSELHIKSDAGLCLSQPKAFADLKPDLCRETFNILSEIAQVLFDAF